MNENLPPGARVLALDTGRSYLEAEIVGPTASPVFQNLDDPVHFTLLHREGGLELYRITT